MGSLKHAKTELLNFSTWKWEQSSPYFNYTEFYSFEAVFYRNQFYVVGGRTKNEVSSIVASFNPMTDEWTQIGNLNFPRFGHTIHVIGDKIYIIGGSEPFEYCNLSKDYGCSGLTDATFEMKDNPILYGFYPSKCKTGTFMSCNT